ncbi:translation initiation factor IF-2-like [Cervus canadensis]|uniref:translation initiation factor IF-2-like n=1 Tax=Cervus canadensis TaxID=1574408 RepID=UPI001C9E944B|nr:translation initiation factor IF-2-like [Cervus canadensis]
MVASLVFGGALFRTVYNPGGVRSPAAPTRSGIHPGGGALATPTVPPPLQSKSDPRWRAEKGRLGDPAGSRAGLRNKPTTSGNFLRWPRCPPPAPSPPPGWVLGADAVTADPGAGPPGPGGRRARRWRRLRGFFQGRGVRGARRHLARPSQPSWLHRPGVQSGDSRSLWGRLARARPRLRAQRASKLCGSRGPARRPARPCPRRLRCGGDGCWARRSRLVAGAQARRLLPARGWSLAALPSAAPRPELSARRAESPEGGPGSGGAAPTRTPGARRPPGPEKQRPPPRPPQHLGRAAAAAARVGRLLAEPAALGFPGSASGEPLLPAPSGSCGGSASRGRARRRRRRRRGEGGRALPRGRDWRAACARGGGAAAAAPSQARERAPRKREPFARPRAPSVSGTRRRAAVATWNLSRAGCAQSPWGLLPSLPFQPRTGTPISEASFDLSPQPGTPTPFPDDE